jgi:hypothetical protein
MVAIKAPRDVGAGLLFIAIGAAGLYFGRDLTYGSSARMGPGFFPYILSWLIIGLGAIVGARGFTIAGPKIDAVPWRPITMVVLSILVFGFAIEYFGLFVSAILLTFLAGAARAGSNYRELAVLGVILAILSVGVFAYGLRQPMPAWPPFLTERSP